MRGPLKWMSAGCFTDEDPACPLVQTFPFASPLGYCILSAALLGETLWTSTLVDSPLVMVVVVALKLPLGVGVGVSPGGVGGVGVALATAIDPFANSLPLPPYSFNTNSPLPSVHPMKVKLRVRSNQPVVEVAVTLSSTTSLQL